MARNQPFDFSDDDDIDMSHGSSARHSGISGSSDAIGSADLSEADLLDETSAQSGVIQSGVMGSKSAKQAAQTQTATRSTTAQQHDAPTSMQHKRGNQPR